MLTERMSKNVTVLILFYEMYFSVASDKVKNTYSNIGKLLVPYVKNDSEIY